MDITVAAITIPVGLLFIIFNKPLAHRASRNLSRVLPWDVDAKSFRIEYILVGVVFIIIGLLASLGLL